MKMSIKSYKCFTLKYVPKMDSYNFVETFINKKSYDRLCNS